jgi:DNA-binding SARP family transcriptional activator
LILNNNESYQLDDQDDFAVDFDVFLRNDPIKFGYILRIISNTDENFDCIINNERNVFLVVKNRDFQLKNAFSIEQWNHIRISFRKGQNKISLQLNDEEIDCPYNLKNIQSLTINFGQCDLKNFLTNDVAPVILKDIHIYYNKKELHHWTLGKHGENRVYDELKNQPAIAHNPHWVMDNRIYWKKTAEFQSCVFPQIAFDSIRNIIYLLNRDELIAYSLSTHSERKIKSSPEVQYKYYNRLMFDPISDKLLFYSIEDNRSCYFDFENQIWIDYKSDEREPTHAHHNHYISKRDSTLYLFGGYGFYKYNSDFFKINLKTNERIRHDFSHTITPRYLSAMGGNANGDKVYILGGRGAEMGRQELSPKNFSDLFEIDLRTLKINYLFDIDEERNEGNIYSNNLVMDSESNSLYVLAYSNKKYTSSISLKKINLKTQSVETLADSIEFYFQDITSFCDLYYSARLSKLIAIASYSKDQKTSDIHIYTLDYPPLKTQDVTQIQTTSPDKTAIYIVAAILLFGYMGWFAIRKWKRKNKKTKLIKDNRQKEAESAEEIQKKVSFYDVKRKSILFLGGFQVFNKEGKNITGEFTPTLKYLLVLIILYSLKNSKGISSSKLQELLWFDKMDESARNNRNVNLRRLRVLLQELGDIDITNQNGYWTIALPDNVLSDYKEILRLIHKIQSEVITKKEDLFSLLELLNYGALLPNIQLEWVDNFKTDFSNLVIDTLMQVINNSKNPFYDQQDIRLKIADALLEIDSINEDAIGIKCSALINMGKKSLAKTTFDNFNKEYKLLLGETYSGSIKNLTL